LATETVKNLDTNSFTNVKFSRRYRPVGAAKEEAMYLECWRVTPALGRRGDRLDLFTVRSLELAAVYETLTAYVMFYRLDVAAGRTVPIPPTQQRAGSALNTRRAAIAKANSWQVFQAFKELTSATIHIIS